MTIFDTTRVTAGSFRNAEFLYQSSSLSGGRKKITHEYPNSTNRYVEDLGGLEKSFTLSCWTDNNVSYSQRDSLINALEGSGVGTLIHPEYGSFEASVINYNITDDINKLGISTFSINFEQSSKNTLPLVKKGSKGKIGILGGLISTERDSKLSALFTSVSNNKARFQSASNTLTQSARKMQQLAQKVQGSSSTFSDFTSSINTVISSANALVQAPSTLATNLGFAFDNLASAYSSSEDLFSSIKGFFGFNERDQDVIGSSTRSQAIRNNQDQINNFISASVISIAYEAAVNIEYTNNEELNLVIDDLEDGFSQLPANLDSDILNLIHEQRIEATQIFSDLQISLPNVNDYVILNPLPLNTLIYNLYGSLELKDTIKELNAFRDTSQISGTIKILTNV